MTKITPRRIADLREIGHNDRLQVDGRCLDVQTEVVGRGPWEVRSTVIEAGRVVDSRSSILPATIEVEHAVREVKARHDAILREVEQGEPS